MAEVSDGRIYKARSRRELGISSGRSSRFAAADTLSYQMLCDWVLRANRGLPSFFGKRQRISNNDGSSAHKLVFSAKIERRDSSRCRQRNERGVTAC